MRRNREPEMMPDDVFSAESIVPPVPVLVIDQKLAELGPLTGLIDRHRVADMLLDIRNAIWTPTEYSTAIAPLLDQKREGVASAA